MGERSVRVFVSSAAGALDPFRDAVRDVCQRLGFVPVRMEEFSSERLPPADVCRRELDGCDVVVLLLAHRYGSSPPDDDRSYTELEYEWALQRPGLALLPFVVEPGHPWPLPDSDRYSGNAAAADALDRLVGRVRTHHLAKQFGDLGKFREDLLVALKDCAPATTPDATPPRPGTGRRLPAPPALHAVPRYVGSAPFTGRVEDLDALDDWARSDDPLMVVEAIGGTGKSALTWHWAEARATQTIDGLAGRLWWSFYDGSASITRFLREVLAYLSGRPAEEIARLNRAELAEQVLTALQERPYLLVLDGVERLLSAYHRFDPSKLRDDQVEKRRRSLVEPQAHRIISALAAVGPSKVLLSTRLMPDVLDGRFGRRPPGVRHLDLGGLTDSDTALLLDRLGIRGSPGALRGFFHRLDNHPLLVGIVAALVRDYRPAPGDFDRWSGDPMAGAGLAVTSLDLRQRRTHILDAALAGLPDGHLRLLGWISVFSGAMDWAALQAINPFRPELPRPAAPDTPHPYWDTVPPEYWTEGWRDRVDADLLAASDAWEAQRAALRAEADRLVREWRALEAVQRADARLDAALRDLEDRGLLWWERASNTYDLHPIVRAYVHDQLEEPDRVRANQRIHDHFEALPPEDVEAATSVEDLHRTIVLFRALIGAGRLADADQLWITRLNEPLRFEIGAFEAVLELLEPLRAAGLQFRSLSSLCTCLRWVGRVDEAQNLAQDLLRHAIASGSPADVAHCIEGVEVICSNSDQLAADVRYTELRMSLNEVAGRSVSAADLMENATMEIVKGRVAAARRMLDGAEALDDGSDYWVVARLHTHRLKLALREGTLTTEQLDKAAAIRGWVNRFSIVELRYELAAQCGDHAAALDASRELGRLRRAAGQEETPVEEALALVRLGRRVEGSAALDRALDVLPRIHPSKRPHLDLARTLLELGRPREARRHAIEAFRQAWADGPPNYDHWAKQEAEELLRTLGVEPPQLPTVDPAAITVPMEAEIRAYIERLREEQP